MIKRWWRVGLRGSLIWLGVVVATIALVFGSFFGGLEGSDRLWPWAWIAWAPVGGLILFRRPGNMVGWSLLITGLFQGVSSVLVAVTEGGSPLPVRLWADLLATLTGMVPWLALIWLLLVFPRGSLEGRLERATAFLLGSYFVVSIVAVCVSAAPMDITRLPSPIAVPALEQLTAWLVGDEGFLPVAGLAAMAVISIMVRWRRSIGIERIQYRWLVLGGTVFLAGVLISVFISDGSRFELIWLPSIWAIPAVIGVSVLRYRLYEIDRVISRTLTYGLVIATLVAAFTVASATVGAQVSDNPVFVAASTLAAAALFNPMRRRLQGWVDRRFNRSRYDAERVAERFTRTLQQGSDVEIVLNGWLNVVSDTMQPGSMGVWLRAPE